MKLTELNFVDRGCGCPHEVASINKGDATVVVTRTPDGSYMAVKVVAGCCVKDFGLLSALAIEALITE